MRGNVRPAPARARRDLVGLAEVREVARARRSYAGRSSKMCHQRADRLVRPRQTPLAAPSPRARVRAPRRRREQPGGPRVLRRPVPTERRRSACRDDATPRVSASNAAAMASPTAAWARGETEPGDARPTKAPRALNACLAVSLAPFRALLDSASPPPPPPPPAPPRVSFVGYLREERGDERVHLPRREPGAALLQQLRERFQRVLRGARVLLVVGVGGQRAEVVLGESRDKLSGPEGASARREGPRRARPGRRGRWWTSLPRRPRPGGSPRARGGGRRRISRPGWRPHRAGDPNRSCRPGRI